VRTDQAYLLDQIAKRYGGKPSDYLELDEYESFQFDAGMAVRYNALDADDRNEIVTAILNTINGLAKVWGAKNVKPTKYDPVVERPKEKNKGDIIGGGVTNMTVTEIVDNTVDK